jgi:hypothetical protein
VIDAFSPCFFTYLRYLAAGYRPPSWARNCRERGRLVRIAPQARAFVMRHHLFFALRAQVRTGRPCSQQKGA